MSDYFIADDLSGALDAAAAFCHVGRTVTIALSPAAWPKSSGDEIVGITTETRNAPPAVAAQAVSDILAQGRSRGARLLYKKIDSTLRGPVAAELAAVCAAMPGASVLFAPANPRAGRTVRHGILLVKGVPVAETDFGRDPVSPVRESSIRALLGREADKVVIVDVETEQDLAAAVARMNAAARSWVAVGSGALARPVAAQGGTRSNVAPVRVASVPSGPILFVGGSANVVSRVQATRLEAEGHVPLREVTLGNPAAAARSALEDARQQGVAALTLEPARRDSAAALRAITTAARSVIQQARVTRVFVTGGETAFALCRQLGIATLTFEAELEPGLSLSRSQSPPFDLMQWAVKPGGFGDELTWIRALNAFRG